jgi:DNA polymerase IIIc chi subunit
MFIEHQDLAGEWHKSGPVLIDVKSEKDASAAAIVKANELFPDKASNVLIRVISGDSNGRPIAEIRRPISN